MKVILDTNAYSAWKRGDQTVVELVRKSEWLHFSPIVVGELLFGFRGGARYHENREQLKQFLGASPVEFVPMDQTVCDRYALVLQQLRAKGRSIPTNDIWIAAHTLALGADLLSFDQHFAAIDGLSWLSP